LIYDAATGYKLRAILNAYSFAPGLSCIKVKNALQRTKGRTERRKKSQRNFLMLVKRKSSGNCRLLNLVSKQNCCGKTSYTNQTEKN
jgi:hypothetical protein